MASAYDLVVVGTGPGGYVAAIRASQLGMKTAVVERSELGGICLNWGCIPTKALLRTSEIYDHLQHLDDFGLSADNVSFDISKIVKRSRKVAGQLSSGISFLMKKNKIDVIVGTAKLAGKGKLTVESDGKTQDVTAKHIVLATGARARSLPGLEPDGETVWTYREAMVPKEMPKKLLVIGSGAIGIEFASFYNTMGADVTVVEVMDRILPVEDEDVSAFALKAFKKQGMKLVTSAKVAALDVKGGAATATIEVKGKSSKETFDKVILAVGITGNVEDLGLEDLGVKVDRGHVVVDGYGRTGVDGIYAIGDLTGPPWLAHKASHEGISCVEKIAGLKDVHPLETSNIPGCTYCRPQVASVGLTEAKAKDAGHEVRVGTFPFQGNGKAIALGEPDGFIKTVFDKKTGELLGAHMIGPEVTELIQGYTVARQLETTEAELMQTVFPHPTLSEAMHESVLDAFGRVLHI
ncbi:dihydrolipoyl dehydrogenase [Pyruvatibacter sp.]|uniref:dihydrolipoyl dehydrogenase n=1 Tax=Pyruvatibacter sp. TaxID=1981328 RepID=UPI0032657AB7